MPKNKIVNFTPHIGAPMVAVAIDRSPARDHQVLPLVGWITSTNEEEGGQMIEAGALLNNRVYPAAELERAMPGAVVIMVRPADEDYLNDLGLYAECFIEAAEEMRAKRIAEWEAAQALAGVK